MEEKKHIRKQVYQLRKEHTDEQIREYSHSITASVIQSDLFKNADTILIYADYNHEVITSDIIKEAFIQKKQVLVPRVEGKEMVFISIQPETELKPGYFGIPEPEEGTGMEIQEGLMIMPGVAFDRNCHRIGYGGGFYDRYLEKHPDLRRMALAFEFQMFPDVPWEDTDIRPEVIITEKAIYSIETVL